VLFRAQERDGGDCDMAGPITGTDGNPLTHPNEPAAPHVESMVVGSLQGTCSGGPTYIDGQQ
jgi:hypothetical protein